MLDMEDLRIRFNQYNELYSNDTEFKKDVYLYTGDAYYKAGDPERALLLRRPPDRCLQAPL